MYERELLKKRLTHEYRRAEYVHTGRPRMDWGLKTERGTSKSRPNQREYIKVARER